MLESVEIVSCSLVIGGIILLFVDKWFNETSENQSISFPKAFKIGFFQVISMIPGVSRSAATIVGGMTQKLTRKNAAEFSFFLAVPTMLAASALELLDTYKSINNSNSGVLIFGFIISFLVAMLAIKTFITFLTKHGFKVFGYYRIILGLVLIILLISGYNLAIFK